MNIHLCLSIFFKYMVRCQLKWKSFSVIWILPGQWLHAYGNSPGYPQHNPNNILTNQKCNVYYLIFSQLPSHLKVVTHILLTFISMSYDAPLSFLRFLMGVLPGGPMGPTWPTVPHPQVSKDPISARPPAMEGTVHCEAGEILSPAMHTHLDVRLFSWCLRQI